MSAVDSYNGRSKRVALLRIIFILIGITLLLTSCDSPTGAQRNSIAVAVYPYGGGLITDLDKGTVAVFSEEKDVRIIGFSPDGRYIYFEQLYQDRLYRIECDKLEERSSDNSKYMELIAENAYNVKILESGKVLYTKRGDEHYDEVLYAFDGQQSVVINDSIDSYTSNGSDLIQVATYAKPWYLSREYRYDLSDLNDVKEYYLGDYGFSIRDTSYEMQSDSMFTYPNGLDWGVEIFYRMIVPSDNAFLPQENISQIYLNRFGNEPELLCGDVHSSVVPLSISGGFSWVKINSTSFTLYDFLDGDTGNESKKFLEHFKYPVYTLYYCDGEDVVAVLDDVLDYRVSLGGNGAVLINTIETASESIGIDDIESMREWDLDTVFNVGYSDSRLYVLDYKSGELLRMSEGAAQTYMDAYDEGYRNLYLTDTHAYLWCEDGALLAAEVINGAVGSFEIIGTNIQWISIVGDAVYYGVADGTYGESCGDLVVHKDSAIHKLGSGIPFEDIKLYEDGSMIAHGGPADSMVIIGADGQVTQIGVGIETYERADKFLTLYLMDDDLYAFDGQESRLAIENVEALCCQSTFPVVETMGLL